MPELVRLRGAVGFKETAPAKSCVGPVEGESRVDGCPVKAVLVHLGIETAFPLNDFLLVRIVVRQVVDAQGKPYLDGILVLLLEQPEQVGDDVLRARLIQHHVRIRIDVVIIAEPLPRLLGFPQGFESQVFVQENDFVGTLPVVLQQWGIRAGIVQDVYVPVSSLFKGSCQSQERVQSVEVVDDDGDVLRVFDGRWGNALLEFASIRLPESRQAFGVMGNRAHGAFSVEGESGETKNLSSVSCTRNGIRRAIAFGSSRNKEPDICQS